MSSVMRQFIDNSYLFGGNAPFIEDLYEKYLANPQSVPEEWREYFDRMQVLPGSAAKDVARAPVEESFVQRAKRGEFSFQKTLPSEPVAPERLQVAALLLVTAYRISGSRWATVDPLKRMPRPQQPELERIALEDDYFVSRKLYPNVDFYSGIVQRALGIPVAMFTCIFSLARTVGWIAQWQEMISDPEYKIGRPRQLYKGATKRDVKPIGKR